MRRVLYAISTVSTFCPARAVVAAAASLLSGLYQTHGCLHDH